MSTRRKQMKNKGITLIALIVTIIILLILAGITIGQQTGSGIFENAKMAKERYENSQELENSILSDYESQINSYRAEDGNEYVLKSSYDALLARVTALENNASNYYTKTEMASNFYSKTEVDNKIKSSNTTWTELASTNSTTEQSKQVNLDEYNFIAVVLVSNNSGWAAPAIVPKDRFKNGSSSTNALYSGWADGRYVNSSNTNVERGYQGKAYYSNGYLKYQVTAHGNSETNVYCHVFGIK